MYCYKFLKLFFNRILVLYKRLVTEVLMHAIINYICIFYYLKKHPKEVQKGTTKMQ